MYIYVYIYTHTWWHFSRVGGKFQLRCKGTWEVCKREGGGLSEGEADVCIHVAEPCTKCSNVSSWWYILYGFYSILSTFTSWLIFPCGALIMKDWYVYYYVAKSCSRFSKEGSCWNFLHLTWTCYILRLHLELVTSYVKAFNVVIYIEIINLFNEYLSLFKFVWFLKFSNIKLYW